VTISVVFDPAAKDGTTVSDSQSGNGRGGRFVTGTDEESPDVLVTTDREALGARAFYVQAFLDIQRAAERDGARDTGREQVSPVLA
jgi:hypothetical protein